MKNIFTAVSAVALLAMSGVPASAFVVHLDNFTVTKNGVTLMNDNFTDTTGLGVAGPMTEPSNDGTNGIYNIFEAGGQSEGSLAGNRTFDTDGAALQPSVVVPGTNIRTTTMELRTNRTDVSDPNGLKTDDTFRVDAIVSLGSLTDLGIADAYGIRLRDRNTPTTVGNDELRLAIRKDGSNNPTVALRHRDAELNVNTVLEAITLSALDLSSHDQVRLTLEKANAGSDTITASYELLSSGVGSGNVAFTSTFDIFNGEDWTRAGFRALDANIVSEPGTLLIFSMALVGLGIARRRRSV
ncbi:MAG: PEP-CTERM sorting domain-containing protein [Alphaproteobacteria bacterium]|nr:PEP-CTERM sorting domain-containing protein [Alphaproteobacteria bacterium]